jgi:hypothetical protein
MKTTRIIVDNVSRNKEKFTYLVYNGRDNSILETSISLNYPRMTKLIKF